MESDFKDSWKVKKTSASHWKTLVKFLFEVRFPHSTVILYLFHFTFKKILEYIFSRFQPVLLCFPGRGWDDSRWKSGICSGLAKVWIAILFGVSKVVHFILLYFCFSNRSYSPWTSTPVPLHYCPFHSCL